MYMYRPSADLYLVYYFIVNISIVISDVMAEGLSVIIVGLKKKKAEMFIDYGKLYADRNTAKRMEDHVKDAVNEGKQVIGNFSTLRVIYKTGSKLSGGLLAQYWSFSVVYAIYGFINLTILITALILPEKQLGHWINRDAGNFMTKISSFFRSLSSRAIILPIIVVLITRMTPMFVDVGDYILSDELKWSAIKLSWNTFVSGVSYFIMMSYIINKLKFHLRFQLFYTTAACLILQLLMLRLVYYDNLSYMTMYTTNMVASICSTPGWRLR